MQQLHTFQRRSLLLNSRTNKPYFRLNESVLQVAPQDIVVKVLGFSVDPVMRVWQSGVKTNFKSVKTGDIFNCFGLGIVVQNTQTDSPYCKGTYMFGNTGTTNYFILNQQKQMECFPVEQGLVQMYGPAGFLYLINNGLAAYSALQILYPQTNENVVVSTAAGATGLLLCHLLQQRHANVIALTSLSKNHVLKEYTNTLLDYRDLEKLKQSLLSSRFRKYFDCVGESLLETVLQSIEEKGTVALCGASGGYGNYAHRGLRSYELIIEKRVKIVGINFSYLVPMAMKSKSIQNIVFKQFQTAKLHIKEVQMEQFENYFDQLFRSGGSIVGKVVVIIR